MLAPDADVDHSIAESVIIPNAVEMPPRPSWPPPKQRGGRPVCPSACMQSGSAFAQGPWRP